MAYENQDLSIFDQAKGGGGRVPALYRERVEAAKKAWETIRTDQIFSNYFFLDKTKGFSYNSLKFLPDVCLENKAFVYFLTDKKLR